MNSIKCIIYIYIYIYYKCSYLLLAYMNKLQKCTMNCLFSKLYKIDVFVHTCSRHNVHTQ